MNRGLSIFLVFLALIVCGAVVGGWALGPNVVALAFNPDSREQPYFLLDFVKAPHTRQTQQTFVEPLRASIEHEGGALLGTGELHMTVDGATSDEFPTLALANFEGSADVVQLLTSSRYRAVTSTGLVEPGMLLGTADPPNGREVAGDWLVWLLESRVAKPTEILPDPMSTLVAAATGRGGVVVWDASVSVLHGDAKWDRLVAVRFEKNMAATEWVHDDRVRTERALLGARARKVALLQFRVDPAPPTDPLNVVTNNPAGSVAQGLL